MPPSGDVQVRQEIEELAALGPLPLEERVVAGEVTEEQLIRWERLILRIAGPVTDEEARILASLFPTEGTAFGLAWSLLHLIETAPHWPLADVLETTPRTEWIERLRRRIENAELFRSDDA